MTERRQLPKALLIEFAPQHWGEVDHFRHFYGTTHTFDRRTTDRLRGITSHFHKAQTLHALAIDLKPNLSLDNEQLEDEGYSPSLHAKKLNAVVETVICELYAALDCTVQVLRGIYSKLQGIPSKSTRKLFSNAVAGTIDKRFPAELKSAIVEGATWVEDLRRLRDTIIHSDIGSCHLNKDTQFIFYMNAAMGRATQAHIIDDIFAEIEKYFGKINRFLGVVFRFLNSQLNDTETQQFCGIFFGRLYTRYVRPGEASDFSSGRCHAYTWFEEEENPTCPFTATCGAYQRKYTSTVA